MIQCQKKSNMRPILVLLISFMSFQSCSALAGDLLWDEVVEVPAAKVGNKWFSCGAGEFIKNNLMPPTCYKFGVIANTQIGPATEMTTQQICDVHVRPKLKRKLVPVGFIPQLIPGANANIVSGSSVWLAVKYID